MLHAVQLEPGTATILYGKRNEVVDDATAQRAFPHARSHILGGCVTFKNSPHLQAVKFCPQCRDAENRWLLAHKIAVPAN